jgi:regulatory protein
LEQKKKHIDYPTALKKLQAFCAYQERSHGEVKTKLLDLGIYGDALEEIIAELIQDNFLNEERFAKAYSRGKFNIKKWGRIRIKQELKLRKISDYCVRKAMEEIEDDAYIATLREIILKKSDLLKEEDNFKLNQKLFSYAIQKGYESELISQVLKDFGDFSRK